VPDQVDRANDIEEQVTERAVERIRDADAATASTSTHTRPPRTGAEIDRWIKQQTSIRPRKPLPKP
jgi:hypothetical protein